jgi:hypothetical protein
MNILCKMVFRSSVRGASFHSKLVLSTLNAKYKFASSNIIRTTFAFHACFEWKLAPLADERSGFFIENLSRRLTRSSTYLTLQTRTWPTGDRLSKIQHTMVHAPLAFWP